MPGVYTHSDHLLVKQNMLDCVPIVIVARETMPDSDKGHRNDAKEWQGPGKRCQAVTKAKERVPMTIST